MHLFFFISEENFRKTSKISELDNLGNMKFLFTAILILLRI